MKRICMIVLLISLFALGGCQRSEDVSVDGNRVVLHPPGTSSATITANGSFSVGQKEVALSADQQALFTQYHDAVVTVHRDRDAIKNEGMAIASDGLHLAGKKLRNVLAHSASTAQESEKIAATMQTKGQSIGKTALTLCKEAQDLQRLQGTLATQVEAFKPYADVNAAPGVNCVSTSKTSTD